MPPNSTSLPPHQRNHPSPKSTSSVTRLRNKKDIQIRAYLNLNMEHQRLAPHHPTTMELPHHQRHPAPMERPVEAEMDLTRLAKYLFLPQLLFLLHMSIAKTTPNVWHQTIFLLVWFNPIQQVNE